jgi:hypothetical protein
VLHVVSGLFSLFILFPLLMGLGAGAAGGAIVEKRRIRAPLLAGAIAFVGGMGGWLTDHALTYVRFLADVEADIGFFDFMQALARGGTDVVSHGHTTHHGETETWVIWLLELFAAGGLVGFGMTFAAARKPFCEPCGSWYVPAGNVAVGNGADKAAARAELEKDDMDALARRSFSITNDADVLALAIERCPTCEVSAPRVTLSRHRAKKNAGRIVGGLLRPDSLRRFARAVEREEDKRKGAVSPA